MRTETIRRNDLINTADGCLIITGGCYGKVYADRYRADSEGILEFDGEEALSYNDIEVMMKEVDGCNHKVEHEEGDE